MLHFLTLFATMLLLSGCGLEAEALPYYNGTFIGSYLSSADATPVGMKLEVQASTIERQRYVITGTTMIGEESFQAEGYELASPNLHYISSQATPPPGGDSFIELKNDAGATVYTLCTSLYYRDNSSDSLRVVRAVLLSGSPGEYPAYCSVAYYEAPYNETLIGNVYLTKQAY